VADNQHIETGKTGKKRNLFDGIFRGDRTLWIIVIALTLLSVPAVYSSVGGTAAASLLKTLRYVGMIVLGIFAALGFSRLNNKSRLFMILEWGMLIFAFITVGIVFVKVIMTKNINERWLNIGFTSFQPSELVKIVLPILVAWLLVKFKEKLNDWKYVLGIMVPVVMFCGLTLPSGLSTTLIIFVTCWLMMMFAKADKKTMWIATLALFMVLMVAVLVLGRGSTWIERVGRFVAKFEDPNKMTYQEREATLAIYHGNVYGQGFGKNVHGRLLSQAENDFIYAFIIEEYGSVIAVLIMLAFILMYFRCIKIAWKCDKLMGKLLVMGLGTEICMQAIINMGVAVGLFPVTGQNLPFVSYGGSSYIFTCIGLGVIQYVAYDNKKEARKARLAEEVRREDEQKEYKTNTLEEGVTT
jgi:cell division protein FtsW